MRDEFGSTGDVIIEEKGPDSDDVVVTRLENEGSRSKSGLDDLADTVKGVANKTGEVINRATESIGKAIESALSARDHVVMVRVNDESLRALDALVQTGIFKSRSESAAFLISEGMKAQSALFERIAQKTEEIERLQNELKGIVHSETSQ